MATEDFWKKRLQEWTVLDKPARIAEVLFGLIMVLTFTGTISVSNTGKQELGELLWAALGCNFAWGLVDGIMYLMDKIIDHSRVVNQIKRIRQLGNNFESRSVFKENIPPLIVHLMEDKEIDHLNDKLRDLPELSVKQTLIFKDFLIAGQIFLLVFLITLPVAMPFLFIHNVAAAMRISNGIALLLLFIGGYSLAKYSGLKPIITALAYMAIGVLLVGMTMVLGG